MKNLALVFVFTVVSFFIQSCGTSPDHSVDSVKKFIENGNNYSVIEIIPVFTEFPDTQSPFIRILGEKFTKDAVIEQKKYFNYIVLVKGQNEEKYLFFMKSKGSDLRIVEKIFIK